MYFTLDDIENLAIAGGRSRLDKTEEYDISYYEKIIEDDIQVIEKLIEYITRKKSNVQDEKTKRFLENRLKELEKLSKAMREKKPREEYENKNAVGYYQSHPYAYFIERDFPAYVDSNYTKIIEAMNKIYQWIKYLEDKKMYSEHCILYEIFEEVKKTCRKLGIHSLIAEDLYNIIAKKDEEGIQVFDINTDIVSDERESMKDDISIETLPYFITLPTFSWEGVGETYQMPVSKPMVWYKQSYIDKLNKQSVELTNMVEESTNRSVPRERNPQESDEDYINYLEKFYSEGTQYK